MCTRTNQKAVASINTENREKNFQALSAFLELIVSRYGWREHSLNFQDGRWDEKSLVADLKKIRELRRGTFVLTKDEKIESSMKNVKLCLAAARVILGRYEWADLNLAFTQEFSGTKQAIANALKEDFFRLADLLKQFDKDGFPEAMTANWRVMDTLKGVMFQAVTSLAPFSIKSDTDQGRYIRVMRCVEGIIYQILLTLNPEFTTRTKA